MNELNINSELFTSMREDFDDILNDLLLAMSNTGQYDGSISLNLRVHLNQKQVTNLMPGEPAFKTILVPDFIHRIHGKIKRETGLTGAAAGEYELSFDRGTVKYGLVDSGQIDMFGGEE